MHVEQPHDRFDEPVPAPKAFWAVFFMILVVIITIIVWFGIDAVRGI